jgi:hypothetical protein
MAKALLILVLCGGLFGDIVPVPGTQRVSPAFEKADLVCNCVVESVRVLEEQRLERGGKPLIRRHAVATVRVMEAYNKTTVSKRQVRVVFDEETPATSASMPALATAERAIMFLKAAEPSLFEFADPFLGATPFSVIPIVGKELGLGRLESALGAILEDHNFDDQVSAMRLLQGFDHLSPVTLARLTMLSSSSNSEAAVSAIAVLLTTKSANSVRRLNEWLLRHNSGGPPAGLMSVGSELGQVTDPAALDALEGITASRYPSLRLGAMMGIRNIRNPQSARALVARLDDPDINVRYLAVITLSEIFAKDGEYAPTMYLFDQNPNFYTGLWKSWWSIEGT